MVHLYWCSFHIHLYYHWVIKYTRIINLIYYDMIVLNRYLLYTENNTYKILSNGIIKIYIYIFNKICNQWLRNGSVFATNVNLILIVVVLTFVGLSFTNVKNVEIASFYFLYHLRGRTWSERGGGIFFYEKFFATKKHHILYYVFSMDILYDYISLNIYITVVWI